MEQKTLVTDIDTDTETDRLIRQHSNRDRFRFIKHTACRKKIMEDTKREK